MAIRRRLALVAGLALAVDCVASHARPCPKGRSLRAERAGSTRSGAPANIRSAAAGAGHGGEPGRRPATTVISPPRSTASRQIYADRRAATISAEPLYKRAIALMEKGTGLDSVEVAPVLNSLAALDQRQGRLRRGRAAVQARARHSRKGFVARASRRRPVPQQSRHALCEAAALMPTPSRCFSARFAIYQKVGGSRASGGRDAPEQSRPAQSRPQPRCGRRSADQALARDPREGAGVGSSRRRPLPEQSRRSSTSISSAMLTPSRSIAARLRSVNRRLGRIILMSRPRPAISPISCYVSGRNARRAAACGKDASPTTARSCASCCRSCSPRGGNICCPTTRRSTRR